MSALWKEYRAFCERGGNFDLSARAKFRLTGADRVRFLNGQTTANVMKLDQRDAMPACITTAKGKLCADVFITATETELFIDADAVLRESLAARVERYIIADDVMLEDVTGAWGLVHAVGAARDGSFSRAANRLGIPGTDIWLPPGEAPACLSLELADLLRIERGVPRWGFELDENTLPAEAGLDRTHVDFHKGCYIGQEVISRVKSVGHVNRELRGFIAEAPLSPGAKITTAADPARDLGVITSATHSFALDRPIALGYLRRAAPVEGLLAGGVPVTLHPLPFTP